MKNICLQGTWELPLKIDRATANDLARISEYRRTFWRVHRKKHERECRQGFGKIAYLGLYVSNLFTMLLLLIRNIQI